MKILILSPSFPFPHSGTQVRIYNVIRNLARHHQITLVSLIQECELQHVGLLEPFCERIELVTVERLNGLARLRSALTKKSRVRNQWKRLRDLFKGAPFDVVIRYFHEYRERVDALLKQNVYDVLKVETLFMEQYVNRDLINTTNTKVVLVEIDIAFVRVYREYLNAQGLLRFVKYIQYQSLRIHEQRAWERVDHIVTVSEVDKQRILCHNKHLRVSVVPNSVDTDYYRPPPRRKPGKELLILGGLDFAANYDGLLFFLREVFPLIREASPDVRLTVVGRYTPAQKETVGAFGSVTLEGYIEDIRPFLDRGNVFIVPLRIGGGTRVKILTAMAAGLPVVSTTVGYEGIEASPGNDILAADHPEEFAAAVLKLFQDRELYRTVQASGRVLVEKRYSWDTLDLSPLIQ